LLDRAAELIIAAREHAAADAAEAPFSPAVAR
jgi:hypothetical protein